MSGDILHLWELVGNKIIHVDFLLEAASSDPHDYHTKRETSDSIPGTCNNTRDGGDDQNCMSHKCHCEGGKNGAVSTPVLIRDIRTCQGHDIRPELVDFCRQLISRADGLIALLTKSQCGRCTLSHAQGTGNMFIEVCASHQRTSRGVGGKRSLDEIHNCVDVSIWSCHIDPEFSQTAVVP